MATIHCHVQIEQAMDALGLRVDATECSGGIAGEANVGANVGDGEGEVYRDKVGVTLNFRTLKAGPNIDITTNGDVIEINSTAGGGNVNGPDPSTMRGIATYGDLTGTLLLDNDVRIATGLDGAANYTYRSVQAKDQGNIWHDLVQLENEGGIGGIKVLVGDAGLDTVIYSANDPWVENTIGRGRVISEKISVDWQIEKQGKIYLPAEPASQRILRLGTGGTNGTTSDIYVGDIDPQGAITAAPGSLFIRGSAATSNAAMYIHKGTGTSNNEWVAIGLLGHIFASDVRIDKLGIGGPWNYVQETINLFGMAGAGEPSSPYISDAGGGTIDVITGNAFIRTSNDPEVALLPFAWAPSSGIAIPTDTTRFIGIEYNGGSPQVTVRTSEDFNGHDDFRLGTVVNEGGILHVLNNPQLATDFGERIFHRLYETLPLQRAHRLGGIIPSGTGRYLLVSEGELYDGFNEFDIDSIDTTGSDTFDAYYRNGSGGWTAVSSQSQWDNANWDDGTGTLNSITNNRWSMHWLYIEADGDLVLLYGQGEYLTEGAASSVGPPSDVPPRLDAHGRLLGRIVYQEGEATFETIVNVWEQVFAAVASAGDVYGPSSSIDDAIVRFDGGTGKLIKSVITRLDDAGNIFTGAGDTVSPVGVAAEGTNGAETRFFVGSRDPNGNVSAYPGAIYFRVNGTTSALYQHRGSGVTNSDWFNVTAAGGASVAEDWRFSTSTGDADPGNGNFRLNNATQSSATWMYIDDQSRSGVDFNTILLRLKSGDAIYVQQRDDSSRFHVFDVTGDAVDGTGTYVKVPISVDDSGADLVNNKDCSFVFLFSGSGGTGGPWTHGSKTQSQMLAISSPAVGDTVYNTTHNLGFHWTGNTWQCSQTFEAINNSGTTLYVGDCVASSSVANNAVTTTSTFQHNQIVGTTVIGGTHTSYVTIAYAGVWDQYINGTASIGDAIVNYTSGIATSAGGQPNVSAGVFGIAKASKGDSGTALLSCQIGFAAQQ